MNWKTVKIIFAARICLWIGALSATIYWIYWSFKIYANFGGRTDEHTYATLLRPILYRGIIIAVACIVLSFILRFISDFIKFKITGRIN